MCRFMFGMECAIQGVCSQGNKRQRGMLRGGGQACAPSTFMCQGWEDHAGSSAGERDPDSPGDNSPGGGMEVSGEKEWRKINQL